MPYINGWIVIIISMFLLNATNQTFTATTNGNYSVEINQNGCIDTSSCYFIGGIGVQENDFSKLFSVYPNPTKGNIKIVSGMVLNEVMIRVTNVKGQLVLVKQFKNTGMIELDIPGPAGHYDLELITPGGKSAMLKVLKN
jgi:hypothetical protein